MKYKLKIAMIFVFIGINHTNAQTNKTQKVLDDTVYLNASKTQFKILKYENNKLKLEAFYINGLKYKVILNDIDSTKKIVFLEEERRNFSPFKVIYFPNGIKKGEVVNLGLYYTNDTILETNEIVPVVLLDQYKIDYYSNGNLNKEATYINGKLNGEYKEYYENGMLKTKKLYYNGVPKGMIFNYNEKGMTISVDTLFFH